MFDRFGVDFGAVLASQMSSGERTDSGQIGTWAVQDGLKIVLVRSFFRLFVRDRFFGRLGLLLGSFLAAPWVVLVLFRHFNSSIQPINSSTRRFKPSTHQPMALRHFLTRPGGLRAARSAARNEVEGLNGVLESGDTSLLP